MNAELLLFFIQSLLFFVELPDIIVFPETFYSHGKVKEEDIIEVAENIVVLHFDKCVAEHSLSAVGTGDVVEMGNVRFSYRYHM